jgi:hypothetical protein
MNRHVFTLVLIPASLAVHLLVAACGGNEGTSQAGPGAGGSGGGGTGAGGAAAVTTGAGVTTGSATTGAGSGGGNVPECMCAPKPPIAYDVPCFKDQSTAMIAELALPGVPPQNIARVIAVAHQTDPQVIVGSATYNAISVPVRIGDGYVMVMCEKTGLPFVQETKSVTFYVPQ